jgi:hypothetical protein
LEELQFLNSLAILNNFDLLLSNELNNSVKIRYGLNGVHSSRNDKYIFNLYNHNMTHGYRDDDEDVDGFAETSDVVKRILQMPLYDGNGNILKGMQVNPQNVGLLNGLIKESVY